MDKVFINIKFCLSFSYSRPLIFRVANFTILEDVIPERNSKGKLKLAYSPGKLTSVKLFTR